MNDNVEKAINLADKIELMETLWTGELIPTDELIQDINELLELLELILIVAPKHRPLENYIAKTKEKRAKYLEILEEEKQEEEAEE